MNLLINNCINIENNIKDINFINEKIKKCNSNKNKNIKFKFNPEENEINNFLETIKEFGKISYDQFYYKFKKCPLDIKEERKYKISGEKQNILTKTGSDNRWMGTICENELEKGEEYKWRIKIIKAHKDFDMMIGVATIDFDIKSSLYDKCGWYLYCFSGNLSPTLYSGPPYNYKGKKTNLKKVKDEIMVIMNMNKRTLKFIIDNEDKGNSYTDIPIDKPLFPAVLLYNKNDSVEIIKC